MPRYDGTGPAGVGPRTGWGLGPCVRGARVATMRIGRFGRGLLGRGAGRALARRPRVVRRRRRFW
jgi:hypothetical protein